MTFNNFENFTETRSAIYRLFEHNDKKIEAQLRHRFIIEASAFNIRTMTAEERELLHDRITIYRQLVEQGKEIPEHLK